MGRFPDANIPLADAATRLGISPDAARKRLERGTLIGKKRDGRWYVAHPESDATGRRADADPGEAGRRDVDATWTPPDASASAQQAEPDAGVERLVGHQQEEIEFLRNELMARTEELRRKDHIIAALTERLSVLAERIPAALPAGKTAPDAPVSRQDAPGAAEGADATDARSGFGAWWRRLFGGA